MDLITMRILWFCLGLFVLDVCLYGFFFGFGVALSLVIGMLALCWLYWKLMSRPRKIRGMYIGEFFGEQFYCPVDVSTRNF